MPGLPGVDQITSGFDGIGQPGQGVADHLIVGKQFIEPGDHRQARFWRQCSQVLAVEGIAFDEPGDVAKAFFSDQRAAIAHVDVAVVTQQDRLRQRTHALHGLKDIAPMACGDVDDAHGLLLFA
ncbi:hypothetical protein D3C77_324130 [compost metagenome]